MRIFTLAIIILLIFTIGAWADSGFMNAPEPFNAALIEPGAQFSTDCRYYGKPAHHALDAASDTSWQIPSSGFPGTLVRCFEVPIDIHQINLETVNTTLLKIYAQEKPGDDFHLVLEKELAQDNFRDEIPCEPFLAHALKFEFTGYWPEIHQIEILSSTPQEIRRERRLALRESTPYIAIVRNRDHWWAARGIRLMDDLLHRLAWPFCVYTPDQSDALAARFADFDVVIFDTLAPFQTEKNVSVEALRQFIYQGGIVLAFGMDSPQHAAWVERLDEKLRLLPQTSHTGDFTGIPAKVVDIQSSLLKGPHSIATWPTGSRHFAQAGSGWKALALSPQLYPNLVEARLGKGRFWATSINSEFLPLRALLENAWAVGNPEKAARARNVARPDTKFQHSQAARERFNKLFDSFGRPLVKGKPFLPYGIYKVPREKIADYAKMGFNVFVPPFGPGNSDMLNDYLDTAQEWGVYVLPEHWGDFEYIKPVLQHPAVLGWYLCDEPNARRLEPPSQNIANYYRNLEMDHNRPVFIADNVIADHTKACDIIGPDIYPIGAFELMNMNWPLLEIARKIKVAREYPADPKRAVWSVLQTIGNYSSVHQPEPGQARLMAWLAACEGSAGFLWYSYQTDEMPDWTLDQSVPLRDAIVQTGHEIRTLASALYNPNGDIPHVSAALDMDYLPWRACQNEEGQYLIALNVSGLPTQNSFTFPGKGRGHARPLFSEGEAIPLDKGTLTVILKPHQVKIWRLSWQ